MRPRNLHEALKGKLSDEELNQLGRSFDIVGDVAIIKIPDELLHKKEVIGKALMKVHHHLKTVLLQTSPVSGELRTRDLEVIAGEPRTETVHKESGCYFKTDLARTYFSPRLAHERLRIANLIEAGEVVTNMFSGVGCYSIIIAKKARPSRVYSIDKNEIAVKYMCHNIRINKVGSTVTPILGDAREVIETRLKENADRVLMPLPEFGRDFFETGLRALKHEGGIIHFYDFGEEPNLFEPSLNFTRKIATDRKIELLGKRKVRSYAPHLYHVVLDLKIR